MNVLNITLSVINLSIYDDSLMNHEMRVEMQLAIVLRRNKDGIFASFLPDIEINSIAPATALCLMTKKGSKRTRKKASLANCRTAALENSKKRRKEAKCAVFAGFLSLFRFETNIQI